MKRAAALALSLAALFAAPLALTGCAADPASEDGAGSAETSEDALGGAAPLGPEPRGTATRYPIVLAHGFLGSANGFAGFDPRVSEALEADGHAVFRASVPPFGDVHQRALALAADVDRVLAETGAAKVDIIAHSMGGLDARELVSTLGYGDRVASLTTIATPHRGSAIADVSLGLLAGASDDALAAIAKLAGKSYGDVANDADLRGALSDLSERGAEAFNRTHPDDARVYYQSWAGVSSVLAIPNPADAVACEGRLLAHAGRADFMSAIVAPAAPFVAHGADPNDGFVRVSSAKWGTFRGCVPADHADEVGFLRAGTIDPHTGFDFVRFYRDVAFDLAARGY
jgi:triacylglycerol lipase